MDELESKKIDVPITDDWGSRSHIQTLVLMMMTAVGIYLCYQMAVPFLSALVWALTLAVLFTPLQHWLEMKLKYASMAALISVLVISLMVVVPVTFVTQQLVIQAVQGSQLIEKKVNSGEWRRALETQPRLAPLVDKIERRINLPETVKTLNTWLNNTAGSIFKDSLYQVLGLCLVFYTLFFFLRDRRVALYSIRFMSPLSKAEMSTLFGRVGDTIHATVYGTFAIALVQGFLGGLMFWWLGFSSPLLWGLVMGLLAIVPMLGAFVVWVPAALFLALEGNWGDVLILTLWGMLVVGTADNLLRPILVGSRLKLHTILAFLSVVGGLVLFGSAGIILGPIILTMTITLIEIWLSRIKAEVELSIENESL